MPRCAVKFCPHYKRRPNEDNTGLMCHLFPSNVQQRKKWEDWVKTVNRLSSYVASPQSGLCSAHFTQDCYTPCKRLRKDAIPSVVPELTAETALKLGFIPNQEAFHRTTHADLSMQSSISIQETKYAPFVGKPQAFDCLSGMLQGDSISSSLPVKVVGNGQEIHSNSYGNDIVLEDISNTPAITGRGEKRKAYVGDITVDDLLSPTCAGQSLSVIKDRFRKAQGQIKALKQSLRRVKERNRRFQRVIENLKESHKALIAVLSDLDYDSFGGGPFDKDVQNESAAESLDEEGDFDIGTLCCS